MTEHAALGASGAHRWRQCPGSIRLSDGLPDTTSEAAAQGTVAHNLAEACLNVGSHPIDGLGEGVEQDGYQITIDQEMVDGVLLFVEYVRERAEGKELFVEEHLDLAPLNPPGPMFGTGDALIWDEPARHLEVVDLKYGKGVVVEVESNEQFFQYALGGVVKVGKRPLKITTTVVQPRIEHEDGPIRSWSFDWDYLVAEKKVMFEDAEATQDPDAPLVVGSHCRWCKAKAICPAQQAQVVSLAQDAFAVEPVFPEKETLSMDQMIEVIEKGPLILDWIKAVGAHALHLAETGTKIPGFKLVEKRTNRRWVDAEATETYLKGRRLKVSERYKRTLISPAQAERVLKAKGGADLPAGLVEKPAGGAALAPVSDKRPERVPGVQEAFGIIAETTSEREEEK